MEFKLKRTTVSACCCPHLATTVYATKCVRQPDTVALAVDHTQRRVVCPSTVSITSNELIFDLTFGTVFDPDPRCVARVRLHQRYTNLLLSGVGDFTPSTRMNSY